MRKLIVISHPEVVVAPDVPITDWELSNLGRERARLFAGSETMAAVGAIWSSTERKAIETATILAKPLRLAVQSNPKLGENDRSATGFLPLAQFEAAAAAFFALPEKSFRGWETANAAQSRIVDAVASIVSRHGEGDLALVTHGAVGTLLWCKLSDNRISRSFDQPGQGHFWIAGLESLRPEFGWRSIA